MSSDKDTRTAQEREAAEQEARLLDEVRDPNTAADRLSAIFHQVRYSMYGVLRALTENPNTPPELMCSLACRYPEEFCRNPIAPLFALEEPAFFIRMRQKRRFLRCADVPENMVTLIGMTTRSWRLREEVSLHVSVAGEVEEGAWQEAIREYWQGYCRRIRGRERAKYAELAALGLAPAWVTDPALAAGLACRLQRASDPETPPADLTQLAESDTSEIVRLAVYLNTAKPAPTHEQMETALPRNWNRSWTEPILERYTKQTAVPDTAERILNTCRMIVCYPHTFNIFTETAMPLYRMMRFCARTTPASYKKSASRSIYWHIRLGAALGLRPTCRRSAEALRVLADDGNRLVRAGARARLADPKATFTF